MYHTKYLPLQKYVFRHLTPYNTCTLYIFYAHFNADECHAWFHLYEFIRAALNAKQAKIYPFPQWDSSLQTFRFLFRLAHNYSSRKLLTDFF